MDSPLKYLVPIKSYSGDNFDDICACAELLLHMRNRAIAQLLHASGALSL